MRSPEGKETWVPISVPIVQRLFNVKMDIALRWESSAKTGASFFPLKQKK